MKDRRRDILEAGLAILREQGLSGLTQPRIAARTKLRQSHLTYYYPTRADLLAAVADVAIEAQLSAARSLLGGKSTSEQSAAKIAAAVMKHDNTRILIALNQAADQEPNVRTLFNKLLDGFVLEIGELLDRLELGSDDSRIDLVHALFVGLSVIEIATSRRNGRARAQAVMNLAFQMFAKEGPQA